MFVPCYQQRHVILMIMHPIMKFYTFKSPPPLEPSASPLSYPLPHVCISTPFLELTYKTVWQLIILYLFTTPTQSANNLEMKIVKFGDILLFFGLTPALQAVLSLWYDSDQASAIFTESRYFYKYLQPAIWLILVSLYWFTMN